jgi:hypothetical protein
MLSYFKVEPVKVKIEPRAVLPDAEKSHAKNPVMGTCISGILLDYF